MNKHAAKNDCKGVSGSIIINSLDAGANVVSFYNLSLSKQGRSAVVMGDRHDHLKDFKR